MCLMLVLIRSSVGIERGVNVTPAASSPRSSMFGLRPVAMKRASPSITQNPSYRSTGNGQQDSRTTHLHFEGLGRDVYLIPFLFQPCPEELRHIVVFRPKNLIHEFHNDYLRPQPSECLCNLQADRPTAKDNQT